MKKSRVTLILVMSLLLLLATAVSAFAKSDKAKVTFGMLYYEGQTVRTIVTPSNSPHEGRDDLYAVPGQAAVAAVAPGDTDYHGGQWAFHSVTWLATPYLLTSEAEVLAAEAAGDIEIERVPEMDFKCPIQP